MRRKTLSVNISAVLLSTILLAKLIVDLVNKKKKVEEIYLELACTIGMLLLCIVATALLIREKKEYKKVECSDSSFSSNNSDEKTEEVEEKQPLLKRSASYPEQLSNKTTLVKKVNNKVEGIVSTVAEKDTSKTDIYYNLTGQQISIKDFGQDESVVTVTFPENYSIKKYKKVDANREQIIQSTKDGIIDDGDKYKPVDFSVNKIEKVNGKGKKEDSYQFAFKFQSTQKDDVYIEINCETLNVYSGWKGNKQKPVAQYFKDLKANDDFLIFLDVKEVLSGSLKTLLNFLQKFFPANDQGLSSVKGKMIYEHFEVRLSQEKSFSSLHIKNIYFIGKEKLVKGAVSMDKTFHIKDILVSDQLINKKQEVEQKRVDDITIQIADPNVQNEVVDEQTNNLPQPQNKEDETDLPNVNSVLPSPSISSSIGSCTISNSSISDIATTELKEECVEKGENDKKQPIRKSSSVSSSRSFLGSQGSIDSAGKPKKKIKEKAKNLLGKMRDVFAQNKSQEGDEGSIDGNKKRKKESSFLKGFTKSNKGNKETSPSSSIDSMNTASVDGIGSQDFAKN